jgi:hypothetical protein
LNYRGHGMEGVKKKAEIILTNSVTIIFSTSAIFSEVIE